MKNIIVTSQWAKEYLVWRVIDLANEKLREHGYQIVLKSPPTYDDNRVYNTNERQRDTRIDGKSMRREATLY